jgi:hypothetical protein
LRKEQELGPSKGAVKSLSTEEQLNNSNLAIEFRNLPSSTFAISPDHHKLPQLVSPPGFVKP